jgi:type II secretory pathway pseudopilin PulG
MKTSKQQHTQKSGFTLVITISLLVLLVMISIALLSLSSVTLRTTSRADAHAIARANARLAMMVALGDLQKQMGPDMRISAEAAIFDNNPKTPDVEGVAQPHWLASYNSWGNWLNTDYTPPGGSNISSIRNTYIPKRANMFRQWLLSMPNGSEKNANAVDALSGWDDSNSVIMVGKGSLGSLADAKPEKITRAYLKSVGTNGRNAWWIGPENHKAKISLSREARSLAAHEWQTTQGITAEVGVGSLSGFEALDNDTTLGDKLITTNTLSPAAVDTGNVQSNFFNLSSHSRGVITSAKTGQLKKDLSLLFEGANMPSPYQFNVGSDTREPSIRLMSADLIAKNPQLPNRHFQSWTNMRSFYRMYRRGEPSAPGGTDGAGSLNWNGSKPYTDVVSTADLGSSGWDGSNRYWRVPILAKITFIYSLLTEKAATPGRFRIYHVYSPVFTYWNPYNTELRIPDGKITMASSAYRVWPNTGEFYLGDTLNKNTYDLGARGSFGYNDQNINAMSVLRSGDGGDIVFKPGELRVFSYRTDITKGDQATNGKEAPLYPGFDPQAIAGEKKEYGPYSPNYTNSPSDDTFSPLDRPGLVIRFSHGLWGGNINRGNTAGSLCWQDWWDRPKHGSGMPITYANDWFNKDQSLTPMTPPGIANVARWVFTDSKPVPVAFCQLVIKGLSECNYESISWDKDWRCRNWIQAPPFYFGSGMYMSENDTIAHTQRLDSPYVTYFGPTSMGEMPKIVGHIGQNAYMGSGSSPFERITSTSLTELPTAPVSSLAGFANMRINPGWTSANSIGVDNTGTQIISASGYGGTGWTSTGRESLHCAETKRVAYQSGVTGTGIGNSFMHPMLPRTDVYQYFNNSVSQDVPDRSGTNWMNTNPNDSKSYNDYWDHVFLLNDALWDDYYVSSLADQTRPGATTAKSLSLNLDRFIAGQGISNPRFHYLKSAKKSADIKAELQTSNGYLKSAKYIMVDGMFNVNSTSVSAWYALFAGIRERQLVYRNNSGALQTISIPQGKKIALSRFETEVSDKENDSPEYGATLPDGSKGWSGVRFLEDDQLLRLAEECVNQVKQRGPFLNFSEFINRRLSNDDLGLMGALQSAIDYDDKSPESQSINFRYKNGPGFMLTKSQMGTNGFSTPEAAEGSRFAGIPGYVIQSDLLKPIVNTLNVRDDTFRIRAYGDAKDANGIVLARAWCEAIVQRMPYYVDSKNEADIPARNLSSSGIFSDNIALSTLNRQFGRKFQIESFRWLNAAEI